MGKKVSLTLFIEMVSHSLQYKPKDWRIIVCAPGDYDLAFVNPVDGGDTWYTPEGMTAAEIMQIPRAKRFFRDEFGAECYIKRMAERKRRNREKGIFQN
jgi:hypothetical protein